MTDKPKVTRTYGPIHFEDLDPHRFEDLVRELIYDFRNWQSIEATGRSGGDEGFDIRAFERKEVTSQSVEDEAEEPEGVSPMEGNLWMIQVKREKEIGPKRIEEIVSDIDSNSPPYGYILAAAANFSKESYDSFREKVREKGVMEFYLWGKAELEDILHFPKNDRILFTFFGISLVSRRRSLSTEIKSVIAIKNKLFRALGEEHTLYKEVLLRDLKDTNYPFKEKYNDFSKRPRWRTYRVFEYHPLGLLCKVHDYFAFVDLERKEFDYCAAYDLYKMDTDDMEERDQCQKMHSLAHGSWKLFPRKYQGNFKVDGIIKYSDIAIVDEKGDILNYFPHLYVDFDSKMGPFFRLWESIARGSTEISLTNEYKRIQAFPLDIEKPTVGRVYEDKKIVLDETAFSELEHFHIDTIFEKSKKYEFLNSGDVIFCINKSGTSEGIRIQITFKTKEKIDDYLAHLPDSTQARSALRIQLGDDRPLECYIYEFERYYGN